MTRHWLRAPLVPLAPHLKYDAATSYRIGCPVWRYDPPKPTRRQRCRTCGQLFENLTRSGKCAPCSTPGSAR